MLLLFMNFHYWIIFLLHLSNYLKVRRNVYSLYNRQYKVTNCFLTVGKDRERISWISSHIIPTHTLKSNKISAKNKISFLNFNKRIKQQLFLKFLHNILTLTIKINIWKSSLVISTSINQTILGNSNFWFNLIPCLFNLSFSIFISCWVIK